MRQDPYQDFLEGFFLRVGALKKEVGLVPWWSQDRTLQVAIRNQEALELVIEGEIELIGIH